MARSPIKTKLSLDRWATLLGINPLHFNGGYVNTPTVCSQPWLQYPYQSADRVGREDVAQAIAEAEANMERFLGYRLLPDWETDEWQGTVRPYQPNLINLSITDIRGFAQGTKAEWGYFRSGGIRASALLEAGATIAYTDPDGDSYNELATVTVTVDAGTSPAEVRAYFPVSNGMVDAGGEDQWEIRPIKVTVSGTTATITFRKELGVLPELQVDTIPPTDDSHLRGVDLSDETNVLVTVDVYRVYNDPQTQASMLWEPFGLGCGCNTGCEVCAYTTQTACLMLRGKRRNSQVGYRPATWDSTTESFDTAIASVARQPDIIRLYYLAGWQDERLSEPSIQMDPELERTVAYYAASLLDRPICECNNVGSWVAHWRRDLAIRGEEGLRITPEDLGNPLGTRRGAINAWHKIRQLAIGEAA